MTMFSKTRKFCAFVLAAATMATAVNFTAPPAEAANSSYLVRFVDNITHQQLQATTVLEGQQITTVANLPTTHSYISPYYEVTDRTFDPGDKLFDAHPSTSSGSLQKPIALDIATGMAEKYGGVQEELAVTIRPQFSVFLTESSSGKVTYDADDPQNPGLTFKATTAINATVANPISVTQNGSITFKSLQPQDPNTGSIPSFSVATATDGLKTEFDGQAVTYEGGKDGNISVRIQRKSQGSGNDLVLQLKPTAPTGTLKAGAEFTIEFRLDTINDLQLTVISEKQAVVNISKDIPNMQTYSQFIMLEGTDTLNSITRNFSLRHIEKRYNDDNFRIDWDYTVTDAGYSGPPIFDFQKSDTEEKWPVTLHLPMQDVHVVLKATVTHGREKQIVEIPVIVRGSGLLPSFVPGYSYQGHFLSTSTSKTTDTMVNLNMKWPTDLDVNNGSYEGFPSQHPYKFTGTIDFGTGLQAASYVTIDAKSGNGGSVDIFLNNNLTTKYVLGSKISNTNIGGSTSYKVPVVIQAAQPGSVTLHINYYNSSNTTFNNSPEIHSLTIADSTPSKDARLRTLAMTGIPDAGADADALARFNQVYPGGIIDYGFDMDATEYPNISVPWMVSGITLKPSYYHTSLKNGPVSFTYRDAEGNRVVKKIASNEVTPTIPLEVGKPQVIQVTGMAEDGVSTTTYTLTVTRLDKSNNTFLQNLTFTTLDDNVEQIAAQIKQVDLTMQYTFNLTLPYAYRGTAKALIEATTADMWAAKPEISPVSGGLMNQLRKFFNTGKAKVDLIYSVNEQTGQITNRSVFTIKVISESGAQLTYTINVTIEPPSEDNELGSLKIYRDKEKEELSFDNKQVFTKDGRDYYLTIPYGTSTLWLEMLPNDEKAQAVRVTWPKAYGGVQEVKYGKKGTPLMLSAKVPTSMPATASEMEFTILMEAQAESDKWTSDTTAPYVIHVTRSLPDSNSLLESMTVTNAADNSNVDTFAFNKLKFTYDFTVPFTTNEVYITPKAQSPLATVTVNGTKIAENSPGKRLALASGAVTKAIVEIIPEAGSAYKTQYVLNITRLAPSKEARLISLTVNGGENMKPRFVPATTNYTVEIPEGTRNFTITATPLDANASLTIDGKAVANGVASQPIVTAQADTKIQIVVTAEDGTTKKTYTVSIRDYNFVSKSSNADLSSLGKYYADLEPSFKQNITEYELYLKAETMSLDLAPQTANSRATVEVYNGSKKLTSYNGNYSTSILSDKNTITIKVTAEDGTEKVYTLNVYRNDKKKQGLFKPITAAMVKWTEDPIVIDISQYAIISADVFNTLKTDYPEKSILFQGYDYSFKIKGTDVKGLVPNTTTYDLNFSFTTPNESLIEDALIDIDALDVEPVYFHFNNHGNLPGKMTMTVNLGREYANKRIYWNYFNEERDRIDYYGYVTASAKGSFSVPITHFSDYIATLSKLSKANDLTSATLAELGSGVTNSGGDNLNGNTNGNITPPKSDNPKTGVRE